VEQEIIALRGAGDQHGPLVLELFVEFLNRARLQVQRAYCVLHASFTLWEKKQREGEGKHHSVNESKLKGLYLLHGLIPVEMTMTENKPTATPLLFHPSALIALRGTMTHARVSKRECSRQRQQPLTSGSTFALMALKLSSVAVPPLGLGGRQGEEELIHCQNQSGGAWAEHLSFPAEAPARTRTTTQSSISLSEEAWSSSSLFVVECTAKTKYPR